MQEHKYNPSNTIENLKHLRRHMMLTQGAFIEQFLVDEDGKPEMSVATFSNLEAKGGKKLNYVITNVAQALNMDPLLFMLSSDEFLNKLLVLFPKNEEVQILKVNTKKKETISQLLNRLTMYFAERIFEGELKKGSRIESERMLAERMNVGRAVIREALKALDVLGLIDIRPGQGTFISSEEANFFIIPLSWSLFLNGSQVEEIIVVRNQLEVKAAELAASCTDEVLLHQLSDISHQISKAYFEQDYKTFTEKDLEFHMCIAKCSQNKVVESMVQTIGNLMRQISGSGMVNSDQLKSVYEEHHKIYGLILAKDSQGAARAMEYHLRESKERYKYR